MSGKVLSSGPSGLSRNCMNKSGLYYFLAKQRENARRRLAQLHARFLAKRTNLNDTGCKACSHLKSKAEREKSQRRCHQRYANSSWTCTLSFLPCPGEKLPRFATFVTAEGQIIRVSNTLRPLVLCVPSSPGATSPGTRFLTRQSANWPWSGSTARDGRSLLLPSTLRPHD